MNKIFEKIYPSNPDEKDINIFKKIKSLSWVEPNLLMNKNYKLDRILPGIINEFKQINIVKNPYKKINYMKSIIEIIQNIIKFNEGEDKYVGVENVGDILNYMFIKANPNRIYSDIEYVKIFCKDN